MARRFNFLAWTILGTVFVGMSVYLILNPARTGVVPNYRFAASHWWEGQLIYDPSTHGFLYAPSFAVLFTPIHFFEPKILGEILWRALGFGLFAYALRSLVALSFSRRLPSTFLVLVLLSVPASLASLNNGQTNLPISACLVLSALALRSQSWTTAAVFLNLALVLKPIALAPWLLALVVFPGIRKSLLAWGGLILGLGFVHPSFSFVWAQWGEFFEKLIRSYTPVTLRVSDLFGALEKAGILSPKGLEKGIRAAVCLGGWAWVSHSYRKMGTAGASWALWVTAALIFTIFNPRAETNSYVLISPLLAYAAVSYWQEAEGGKWKGIVLAAACIGLMCDGMSKPIYLATDVWFKPLIVLVVSPLLFRMPEAWKAENPVGTRKH